MSSIQTEIEGFLDSICQRFAGNLGVECKTFVDEYTPFVVDLIAGELNPATFCKTLGLCPANQSIKPILPKGKYLWVLIIMNIREMLGKL